MVQDIIIMLSGLAILLVGFKLLSDNIEKLANQRLKKMFNKTSKNPFVGVGIGAGTTAIIQSSAASTVMLVGFVNAGIMNLYQATAMIMGANIGTTITAQIAALGAFDFSLYAMLLGVIGIFMQMLFKNEKIKSLGLAICGLGFVFIGLFFMQDAMSSFKDIPAFNDFLTSCNNPILLLLFGIIITALVQSSSAITTILISLVSAGMCIGSSANGILFVILGSNIGTTITALLSSIGASVNAKRTSFIHLLFNVLGALLFFIILLIWPSFMDVTFKKWFSAPASQIAMFHTFFNVVCTLLFLPFINLFVRSAEFVIKDKKSENKSLSYIDERFLKTPAIALSQAAKETFRLGSLCMDTLSISIQAFLNKSTNNFELIESNMKDIDTLNQDLLTYLVKVSALDNTNESEKIISTLHKILNDFYREAEIADNMMKYTKSVLNKDLIFSDQVYEQIKNFMILLQEQFERVENMYIQNQFELIKKIDEIEEIIDNQRSTMINQHIERLEKNECHPASSGVFINLVSNLERAGDHLSYIAHAIIENQTNN